LAKLEAGLLSTTALWAWVSPIHNRSKQELQTGTNQRIHEKKVIAEDDFVL
jgi:hypothetical protein